MADCMVTTPFFSSSTTMGEASRLSFNLIRSSGGSVRVPRLLTGRV